MTVRIAVFLLLIILAGSARADVVIESSSHLEAMMAAAARDGVLDFDGESVLAVGEVARFYGINGNMAAWSDPATVTRMLAAIESVRADGLDPEDYHVSALATLGPGLPADPVDLARRDVLLTDALYVMLYHLAFGKADPNRLDKDWNFDDLYETLDLADTQTREELAVRAVAAVTKGEVDELFARARPDQAVYEALRAAYAIHLELAAAGGWPEVPAGATLREGDDDPRVAVLRTRLARTRDLAPGQATGSAYDAELTAAVLRFQARHGLDTDGAVGPRTLAALNVSAAERADQLRVNLERARWVMSYDNGGNFVLVNISGFYTWLVRKNELVWASRVQVGKPYTRSPVFTGTMTYLEFNPTWTVPASIANRSILPAVKKDPGYLAAKDMVLLDNQGNEIPPETVDWNTVTRMPCTVRQNPGPQNALGRVKFIFPNKHAVYLHDTPSRQHFSRSTRAFSSGCIRVENPLELAALLLDDQSGWDRDRIDAVMASGKRTTVRLTDPLPVFLIYWTAFVMADGQVNFREDIYGRDAPVLATLQGPVRPHARHVR